MLCQNLPPTFVHTHGVARPALIPHIGWRHTHLTRTCIFGVQRARAVEDCIDGLEHASDAGALARLLGAGARPGREALA